jgi:hypothetical protein
MVNNLATSLSFIANSTACRHLAMTPLLVQSQTRNPPTCFQFHRCRFHGIDRLVYDNRNIDRSVTLLRTIVGRMFGDCATSTIIVDNAFPSSSIRNRTNGTLVIGGDNRLHEFSGWERGYEAACDEFDLTDRDLILFANDTFDRHVHQGYLDTLDRTLLETKDVFSSSIGFCDDFPHIARLLDLTHRW